MIRRLALAIIAALWVLPAYAQVTQAQVNALIASSLPSCGDFCISATALRGVLATMNQATFQGVFGPGPTTALTDAQVVLGSVGTRTAQSIYCPFSVNGCSPTTGGTENDVGRFVLDLESVTGGTVSQANAVGAYAYCNVNAAGAAYPAKGNCVALSGFAVGASTGSLSWGIATDCQDNSTAATYLSGGNRACFGAEFDVGIWDTTGTAIGNGVLISLQGGGTSAHALVGINIVNASFGGLAWNFGYQCDNAAISIACLNLGATAASGTSIGSQAIAWEYFNGAAANKAMTMATPGSGGFVFVATDTSITNAMDWSGVTINTCTLKIASRCSVSGSGAGNFAGMTVTGSFTATGLVTNADLVNASTTVNGVTCTLGSTCTVTAAATLTVGSSTISGSCTSGFNLYNNAGVLGCQANGGGSGIVVGTTTVSSGTTQQILYDNAGVVGEITKGNNCVYGTNGTGVPSCGTTLPSAVVASSLTSVGTLTGGATGAGFTVALGTSTVTGQMALANGGTNANLTASNGGIFYSTASAGAILAGTVTAGQCLLSGSSAAPTWGSCPSGGVTVGTTTIASGTTQQLLYDNAGVLGEITKGNNCVYGTNGTGVPSCVTTLPFVVSLATGGTGANITGVSGGIPYFASTSVMGASALLTANCAIYGGGAGVAPATSATTCPTISSTGQVNIQNTTASVSTISGSLVLNGGLGLAGDIHANGSFIGVAMALTAQSTITTNGQFVGISIIQQSTLNQIANIQCLAVGCDNGALVLSNGGGFPKVLIEAASSAASTVSFVNNGIPFCFGALTCTEQVGVTGSTSVTGAFVARGSVPTGNTGTCATGVTVTGGATAGNWTSTNACNVAGTIILTGLPTAPTGYACDAWDITTANVVLQPTGSTAASHTWTVRTTNASANDNIRFKCIAY